MSAENLPAPAPTAGPDAPERRCANCDAVLLGEHCYACGQPTKGLVRHFSSIIGDFMDSVFELDSRILRTIGPLLFKPGHLTLEYFAGRRVRYVSPVRLFVFLSLLAFFAAQLAFDISDDRPADTEPAAGVADGERIEGVDSIRAATTVEDVERLRDGILADLAEARASAEREAAQVPGLAFGVGVGMDVAEQTVRNEAERRLRDIREAEAAGEAVPVPDAAADEATLRWNGLPWDPAKNPAQIEWLGEAGNAQINEWAARANENAKRVKDDPNQLKDAFLSAVPSTLFVLLPLFALMLKVMYLFKKRLYMEHLIVALHSHAFLCAGLLVAVVLDALAGWSAAWPWLSYPLGWFEVALIVWMPLYLLLMQKRVYRQGWIMTVFKYWVLGTCYFVLVGFGSVFALMVSMVKM